MPGPVRVVHYLNQFFAGIGGEEAAGRSPAWLEGARGPGQLIGTLAPGWEVVGTLAAGDGYVASDLGHAVPELVRVLREGLAGRHVDAVVAGPAFNAGRYGLACAALCQRIQADLGLPAVTAMYPENPAVDIYRRHVTIVRSGADVMDMREALARLLRVAAKRVAGELVEPAVDDTITAGLRQNYFARESGARRAIEMLMRRVEGGEATTEYPMPEFDRVAPAPGIGDARRCTIALVTSGGIVPRGNPDQIEAANASRFGEYSLEGLEALSSRTHQSVHGGYDPTYANEDPNRVLPLDSARAFERSGRIGRLHPVYFATVGNATSVERAKRYGADIAVRLVNEGVQAVVFTST